MRERNRIDVLDALRGLAALSVVLFHYTSRYPEHIDSSFALPFSFSYGHYGVQLFFMISGFVIFLSVKNTKRVTDFAFKRFTRLFPTFWISMITTYVAMSFFGLERLQVGVIDFVANFTMVPKLMGFRSVDGVYWSLIPELFFYCFIGVLLLTRNLGRINLVCMAWLLAIGVHLVLNFPMIIEWVFILNFGAFFIAGIYFYKLYEGKSSRLVYAMILAALTMSIVGCEDHIGKVIISLCFLLFYLLSSGRLSILAVTPFLFLGEISYPLYLIHQNIGYSLMHHLVAAGTPVVLVLLIPTLLSILLATVITRQFEKPIINKLRGWYKSRYAV